MKYLGAMLVDPVRPPNLGIRILLANCPLDKRLCHMVMDHLRCLILDHFNSMGFQIPQTERAMNQPVPIKISDLNAKKWSIK